MRFRKKLHQVHYEKLKAREDAIAQSPDEIARLHLEIILSENPHFRYQSSEYVTKIAASKLRDPTTDALLDGLKY